ncbi:antiviral reverse transcriptase Drt3a [Pleionea sediminis]|uniref:antiviral reverse transcriptase Drt3a n=1 Tax=Pleionea sediminis TaxID=2569479 RepID=UPI001185A612|nr:antiviral reverse transcriptase Drt3a [Pleionea sediminis]
MDYSYTRANLARLLNGFDFYKCKDLLDEDYRKSFIQGALKLAENFLTPSPTIKTHLVDGKQVYQIPDLAYQLVLRKCTANIKSRLKLNLKPRTTIIRELKIVLSEGSPYSLFRLDIKDFFETCSHNYLLSILKDNGVDKITLNIIENILKTTPCSGTGIPRGLSISSVLAESYLKNFDKWVMSVEDIFYYSRYVDDIIIVANSKSDNLLLDIETNLPDGLNLNRKKTNIIHVNKFSSGENNPVANFDYLGYQFQVIDDISSDKGLQDEKRKREIKTIKCTRFRRVDVDISKKKLSKFQTKIYQAIYSFGKSGDFSLLVDRFRFLTTNRDIIDKLSNRKIPSGIYYNYSEVEGPISSLDKLDDYLKVAILHPPRRLKLGMKHHLSNVQKSRLMKISFKTGFRKKVFKRFSLNRLQAITRIWK